jgi:hypothetical protein
LESQGVFWRARRRNAIFERDNAKNLQFLRRRSDRAYFLNDPTASERKRLLSAKLPVTSPLFMPHSSALALSLQKRTLDFPCDARDGLIFL